MEIQQQTIRNKLIDRAILYGLFFVYPLLIASLIRICTLGWISLFYFHISFTLMITLLYLLRSKLSVNQKVFFFSAIYYLFSFVGSVYFGLAAAHFFYVFVVIINALVLGKKQGVQALILAVVGFVLVALLHSYKLVQTQVDLATYNANLLSWVSYVLAFVFVFTVSIATISMYNDFFKINIDALKQKITDYQIAQTELQAAKTELEQQNIDLLKLNEECSVACDKAEESNRLKTAFLQNVSHEIRTPLNAIEGFSNMLNAPDLTDDKRRRYTHLIIDSSSKLLSIVSDIITISSLEKKQEKVNFQKTNINSVILDLYRNFSRQLDGKNISLNAQVYFSNDGSAVYTDSDKLSRVLSYLLINAIKFTNSGSIDFGYTLLNNELVFFVKDTGVGIDIESQRLIFESFAQADVFIRNKYGGTGLGLSISKGFVELLGGRIWVESEPGKGSTFRFTIPYRV